VVNSATLIHSPSYTTTPPGCAVYVALALSPSQTFIILEPNPPIGKNVEIFTNLQTDHGVYTQTLTATDVNGAVLDTLSFDVNIQADCSAVSLLANGDSHVVTYVQPSSSSASSPLLTTFNKAFADTVSQVTTVPSSCGAMNFSLDPSSSFVTFDPTLASNQISVESTDPNDIGTHVFSLTVTMVDDPSVTLTVPDFFTLTIEALSCSQDVTVVSVSEEEELLKRVIYVL